MDFLSESEITEQITISRKFKEKVVQPILKVKIGAIYSVKLNTWRVNKINRVMSAIWRQLGF